MWKKDHTTLVEPSEGPAGGEFPRSEPPRPASPARAPASIGSSITIRGEVTGDEDLIIEGKVDGSVDLKQHSVTVGVEGQVKAGVTGRAVTVEGSVEGDLRAEEIVVLRSSARVLGDITAPRVVLEDGASFRGAVNMGSPDVAGRGRSSLASRQEEGRPPGRPGETDGQEGKVTAGTPARSAKPGVAAAEPGP